MRRLALRFGKTRKSTGDSSTLVSPSTTVSASESSTASGPGSLALELRDAFNEQATRHNRLFRELLDELAAGHGDRRRKFVELLQRLDVAFDSAQHRRREEWRALQRDLRDYEGRFGDAHFPKAEAAREESSGKGLSYCVERTSRYSAYYVSDLAAVQELVRLLLRESFQREVIDSIQDALSAFVSAASAIGQVKLMVDPPACETDELLSPRAPRPVKEYRSGSPKAQSESAPSIMDILLPLDLAKLDATRLKEEGDTDIVQASRKAFSILQGARQSAYNALCDHYDTAISAWDQEFLERQQQFASEFSSDPCLAHDSYSSVALSATVMMNYRSAESRRLTDMERAWQQFLADVASHVEQFNRKITAEIRLGLRYSNAGGFQGLPPPHCLVPGAAIPPLSGSIPLSAFPPMGPIEHPPWVATPFSPSNLAAKPKVLEPLPILTREQLKRRTFFLAQDSREEEFNEDQSGRRARAEDSETKHTSEFRNFAAQCEARGVQAERRRTSEFLSALDRVRAMHEANIATHYAELARAIDRAFERSQNARERALLAALATVNTQMIAACDKLHSSISDLRRWAEPTTPDPPPIEEGARRVTAVRA